METTFAISQNFKGIMDILNIFGDVATFYYREDGITIQARDFSNISLCSIQLYMDQFTKHKTYQNLTGYFSFSLKSMKPILKTMKDDDIIHMNYKNDIIEVIINNSERENIYDIKTMDVDEEQQNLHMELEHSVILTTSKPVLTRILNDIKYVESDGVQFTIDSDNHLQIVTQSEDCKLKITTNSIICVNTTDEKHQVDFANKYLQYIQKMLPICVDRFVIKVDRELPFVFTSQLKSSQIPTESTIVFYLAPKIKDE